MRQACERSSLSHAVPLDHCIAESPPKTLSVCLECCTTGDEGPKAPAEATTNVSKGPPLLQKGTRVGCGELFRTDGVIVQDFLTQSFKHTRHSHHDIDSLFLYCRDDLRRLVR